LTSQIGLRWQHKKGELIGHDVILRRCPQSNTRLTLGPPVVAAAE
jgi:hypothetical protein